ncbi:hypothetical protein LTR53_004187 [Teratosphaeriaceae sp. CCFEE 6253]|nr:hypothetical protein LTR53_004187 [Teratosphaeriaceae sp. CCFEE 6253]
MDASSLSAIRRRPTLEQTPSNPHVNADLDHAISVEPGSADPKPTRGEQTKQLPPLLPGERSSTSPSPATPSANKLPPLQTSIAREKRPDPALSSPLDPLTSSNLHSAPAVVVKSQWQANALNEATEDSRAMEGKNEVENELHSKVPESPATSESPITSRRSLLDLIGFARS